MAYNPQQLDDLLAEATAAAPAELTARRDRLQRAATRVYAGSLLDRDRPHLMLVSREAMDELGAVLGEM